MSSADLHISATPRAKHEKLLGIDPAINALAPRTSFTGSVDDLFEAMDLPPVNTSEMKQNLCADLGLTEETLFSDIIPFVKNLSSKAASLDNASHSLHVQASKIMPKLVIDRLTKQKTILALTQENVLANEELVLTLYGNLISITNDSKRLGSYVHMLDELRVQLNKNTGFEDKVENNRLVKMGSGLRLDAYGNNSSPMLNRNSREPDRTSSEVELKASQQAPPPTPGPSGMKLFAKLPKQIADSALEKPELMRLSAVYELIETELDYVKDLQTMINFHKVQMATVVSELETNQIFSNIEQLLVANQMNTRKDQNVFISEVGDLLIECAPSFQVYCTYASNYPSAMKLVYGYQQRSDMKDAMAKWQAAPEGRGLSLESFLIKPVQRICKYPLLIRELERFSEKAGNTKDRDLLKLAAVEIEKVVTLVNEATREAEEKERIRSLGTLIESPTVTYSLIQPLDLEDKVHLKDGMLQRMVGGKLKERYVILYADLILVCIPLPRVGNAKGKYELECGYSLPELGLGVSSGSSTVKGPKGANFISLQVLSGEDKDNTIQLAANTVEEGLKWLDIFHLAFKDITEEHRTAVRSLEQQERAAMRQSSAPDFAGKRGAKSGLSSIAMRKAASRKSAWGQFEKNAEIEPPEVKINGDVYKRSLSAIGIPYYYSITAKQSIWKLPNDYTLEGEEEPAVEPVISRTSSALLSNDGKPSFVSPQESTADLDAIADQFETEEEGVELATVEGFPDWRKVDRGDGNPYYFHIVTQETRWEPPTAENP